jgi:hypothetical protein
MPDLKVTISQAVRSEIKKMASSAIFSDLDRSVFSVASIGSPI